MELSSILLLIIFLGIFGGVIYLAISTSSKDQKAKQELASRMGFALMEADAKLAAKISRLYQRGGRGKYQLRNVSRRLLPDGEMYLFDLIETSGDDDSWTEQQAVAVLSSQLRLPHLTLFPKADQKYALSGVANKILEWGMTFVGKPIPFPEFPVFNDKYVVIANEPDLARIYLDENLLRYFSQTQMFMLRAMGDIFTFNEMDPKLRNLNQENLSRRINRAMEVYRALKNR